MARGASNCPPCLGSAHQRGAARCESGTSFPQKGPGCAARLDHPQQRASGGVLNALREAGEHMPRGETRPDTDDPRRISWLAGRAITTSLSAQRTWKSGSRAAPSATQTCSSTAAMGASPACRNAASVTPTAARADGCRGATPGMLACRLAACNAQLVSSASTTCVFIRVMKSSRWPLPAASYPHLPAPAMPARLPRAGPGLPAPGVAPAHPTQAAAPSWWPAGTGPKARLDAPAQCCGREGSLAMSIPGCLLSIHLRTPGSCCLSACTPRYSPAQSCGTT